MHLILFDHMELSDGHRNGMTNVEWRMNQQTKCFFPPLATVKTDHISTLFGEQPDFHRREFFSLFWKAGHSVR